MFTGKLSKEMSKDRTKNTDKFSEIAKRFAEKDTRFSQAIYIYIHKLEKDGREFFAIENDEFEAGLIKELDILEKGTI